MIQTFINRKGYRRYLEIGVHAGDNFLLVRASHKTAVDPAFCVPLGRKLRNLVGHPAEIRNRYIEITSDEYFEREATSLCCDGLDIALVDGAHSYEQSYRDIRNALRYLRSDGVILAHDCNPPTSYAALTRAEFEALRRNPPADWTWEWCGDVWKAIARLRIERSGLGVCVLDCDYGIGVITPFPFDGDPPHVPFSVSDVEAMSYVDFVAHREILIGLRPAGDLEVLVGMACRQTRGSTVL